MYFSSENFDGVHPRIMEALIKSNNGFAASYGTDEITKQAIDLLRKIFNTAALEVFFCFNGTGANNFALSAITEKCSSIFCAEVAHLYVDESTAPETFTACRLYPVKTANGKIIIADFLLKLKRRGDVHHPQPAALSITQPTEYGTIYSVNELKEIAKHCKANNILLHIDGARIFNALVAMDCSFSDLIKISGVDVLTMGGTKAGLMFGEAVLFFDNGRFRNLKYIHKRSMQLASKNRFIAAQFIEILKDNLWKEVAGYTNALAKYFEQQVASIDQRKIAYPVETNMVFMKMDAALFEKLKSVANFYRWKDEDDEVRFVFSLNNTRDDIDVFFKKYKGIIKVR